MNDINLLDLKTTYLRLIGHAENSSGGAPVLWELSLKGQMLAMFANHDTAVTTMLLAYNNEEQLRDLVNERVDVLRKHSDIVAQYTDASVVSLHKARLQEIHLRNRGTGSTLVQFEEFGLHWETHVSGGTDCDSLFWVSSDPYGRWVDATDLMSMSDDLYEAVCNAALEAL